MHTPGHALVNYFVLRKRRVFAKWILVGAIAPDLPIIGLYFYHRFHLGKTDHEIWSKTYFSTGYWQDMIDLAHSFPLAALGWFAARIRGSGKIEVFFASLFLHSVFDFPLHHDDTHRHFFPFSNWRWHSPLSYWDPAHYGRMVFPIELLAVCVLAHRLWREELSMKGKAGVVLVLLLYLMPLWYFISFF